MNISIDTLPNVSLDKIVSAPNISAVYVALSATNQIIYIGRTKTLRNRLQNHLRTSNLKEQGCVRIAWYACSIEETKLVEAQMVRTLQPLFNIQMPDLNLQNDRYINHMEQQDLAKELVHIHSFGQRLTVFRLRKKYSQRELEKEADITHGIVARLERDHATYPSIPVAMQLAKTLGVTLDYLVGMYET